MTKNFATTLLSGFAAAALVGMIGFGALAQEKAATPKKEAKAPSACKGLDETDCKAKKDCSWHKASKNAKGEETRKAHCQAKSTKPKTTAKKTEKKE